MHRYTPGPRFVQIPLVRSFKKFRKYSAHAVFCIARMQYSHPVQKVGLENPTRFTRVKPILHEAEGRVLNWFYWRTVKMVWRHGKQCLMNPILNRTEKLIEVLGISLLIGQQLVDRMTCQLAFLRRIASIIVLQLTVKMRTQAILLWQFTIADRLEAEAVAATTNTLLF